MVEGCIIKWTIPYSYFFVLFIHILQPVLSIEKFAFIFCRWWRFLIVLLAEKTLEWNIWILACVYYLSRLVIIAASLNHIFKRSCAQKWTLKFSICFIIAKQVFVLLKPLNILYSLHNIYWICSLNARKLCLWIKVVSFIFNWSVL